jgi:hypothetical protein
MVASRFNASLKGRSQSATNLERNAALEVEPALVQLGGMTCRMGIEQWLARCPFCPTECSRETVFHGTPGQTIRKPWMAIYFAAVARALSFGSLANGKVTDLPSSAAL